MIGFIFRKKRRVAGKLVKSRTWWCRYGPDRHHLSAVKLNVVDEQVARTKLAEILRDAERVAHGITPPQHLRDGAIKPMADHLEDFVADLRARQRSEEYCSNTERLVTRLLTECNWKLPGNVSAESFINWRSAKPLSRLNKRPLAPKTLNEYLNHANALLGWMRKQGRILVNPLADVSKVETRGKEVRKRRAYTDQELAALLKVAGPRRVVYLTAVQTGLRRGELEALVWADVHLGAPRPFINARSSITKNKNAAALFLRDDLVEALGKLKPSNVMPGVRVFKRARRWMNCGPI